MARLYPNPNPPTVKERLELYSVSNLQKLDKLITFCIDYLQIKGVQLGKKVLMNTIILSNEKMRSEGIEIFEVTGFITLLNELNNGILFTFPLEKKPHEYDYFNEGMYKEGLQHFQKYAAAIHGFESIDELQKNTIIEYHDLDVYKIFLNIQGDIKNVLSERIDRGNREFFSDEDGEVSLDKDIILSAPENKKPYLKLKGLNSSKFQKKSIQPRTANIINFLYRAVVNKHDRSSYTTKELAEKFTETQKSTGSVSNQIKAVNDLSGEFKVKKVFIKNIERKWQLNPDLDCGKLTH